MEKDFCKVLVLGEPFNDYTGMGVTLTNLFKEWPTEKMAVASNNLNIKLCEKIRPCSQYVITGKSSPAPVHRNKIVKFLRHELGKFYMRFGHSDLARIPVSEDLKRCIDIFNPDIVFSTLGSLDRMNYLQDVMAYARDSKYVIYITDDWCNTRYNGRFFRKAWKKAYDDKLKEVLEKSALNLSICPYMSAAYKSQFGADFIPFHNPVDTRVWNSVPAIKKYGSDLKSIVYVGKINKDTKPCLKSMSRVVERMNSQGKKVIFDIYSPDQKDADEFSGFRHTTVNQSIPNAEIPGLLKSYDCLLLPLGFSKSSREYTRLSMPTKLTEYMASGVPMIVNCPEEIALSKYATDSEFAFVCNSQSEDALYNTVLRALTDMASMVRVVRIALKEAEFHDVHTVREQFRKVMMACI